MTRILILTSTVGFMGRACWTKILIALFVALLYLMIFLYHRPCTFDVIMVFFQHNTSS